jgi:nucleotide-binding universal stress UspA family protein
LPLPALEVAAIGAKVATALHDLHGQHVIHLDVKPSNVVVRESGEVALVDFGLSHHDQLPDLMDEEFRLPYGTAPYMAPEQVLGVRSDPRSDIFALGVMLYFFSTGYRPFGWPKGKRGLQRRLWWDPVPPRKLDRGLPPWLQEIILRCLEVEPARRHPTAAQLAFDLSNPGQVRLTARSERLARDPWSARVKRRFNPDAAPQVPRRSTTAQISSAPIVAVALDLSEGSESLADALRTTAGRLLETVPGARVACLNVLKQHRIALDTTIDAEGRNKHVQRLVELQHWARPLALSGDRITYHVLVDVDPAAALLTYARTNHVDHIILGARTDSALRNLLGSVSGEVVAKAPCTVTVVRPSGPVRESSHDQARLTETRVASGGPQ